METTSRIIPKWRNADCHLISPANPHLDDVVWRLNLFMRGYELGHVRFSTIRPGTAPQTTRTRLQNLNEVELRPWYGQHSLVIPTDPDVALLLEGFELDDEQAWGTVEFEGAEFVKITRPINLTAEYAYEHDVFWRHRPLPS
jgi:hypothetical protein